MAVRPSARGWVVAMKEAGESTPRSVLNALSSVLREWRTWKGFRKLIQLVEWKWMGAERWGRNGTGRPLCLLWSLRSEVMMAWIKTRKCQRKGYKYLDFCDIKIINLQTLFYPPRKNKWSIQNPWFYLFIQGSLKKKYSTGLVSFSKHLWSTCYKLTARYSKTVQMLAFLSI